MINFSPADILRWLLIAQDPPIVCRPQDLKGSTPPDVYNMPAWPCFVPSMNVDGNYAVAIRETAGVPQGRFMRTGEQQINPGVQIKIRSMEYKKGYHKGIQIISFLDALNNNGKVAVVCGDTESRYYIHNCSRKGNLLNMGQEDEKQREIFVVNYVLTLEGGVF